MATYGSGTYGSMPSATYANLAGTPPDPPEPEFDREEWSNIPATHIRFTGWPRP